MTASRRDDTALINLVVSEGGFTAPPPAAEVVDDGTGGLAADDEVPLVSVALLLPLPVRWRTAVAEGAVGAGRDEISRAAVVVVDETDGARVVVGAERTLLYSVQEMHMTYR